MEALPSLNEEWTCIAMPTGRGTSCAQAARWSMPRSAIPSAPTAPMPAARCRNERLEIVANLGSFG